MVRLFGIAFALVVAAMAALIITSAAQSATESFRANFHNASVTNR